MQKTSIKSITHSDSLSVISLKCYQIGFFFTAATRCHVLHTKHKCICLIFFTIFLMYMSRWFYHHLYESFNEQRLLNSYCVSLFPKQLKWHHLKRFMSFQKAPSGTSNVCTQLLFCTCTDTPKACKQTLMCKSS